jgi:HSP20 family protein
MNLTTTEAGRVDHHYTAEFYPLVDLQEAEDKYLLDVDLPGVDENSLDIDFHGNTLTIKGEKFNFLEAMDASAISVERGYGYFTRDIAFNKAIDQNNINAKLKGGVLHIELKKKDKLSNISQKILLKN